MTTEKEIIAKYKNMLIDVLATNGVPDKEFTIKIADKPHPSGFVGWYKAKSAFRSRAIFYVDVKAHEELAQDNSENPDNLVLSTLLHEYGHVIEERVQDKSEMQRVPEFIHARDLIIQNFSGNEDFAEDFALHFMGRDIQSEKVDAITKVTSIFAKNFFTDEEIKFGQREKWDKEITTLINQNEDFMTKLSTKDGSFNQCRRICEIFFETLSKDIDVKIIRLEGFKGDVLMCHKKWHKIGANNMVHYALLFKDQIVYDFTYNQFKENSKTPIIENLEKYLKEWDDFSYFKSKSTNNMRFGV